MKCPQYEMNRTNNMEKTSAAAESMVILPKTSPVKNPTPIKPQCLPEEVTTVLLSHNDTRAVHNKENSASTEHERTLDEKLEDSGYLSLHNSQIADHYGEEEDDHMQGKATTASLVSARRQEKRISPNNSPSKCQGSTNSSRPVSGLAASTPVDRSRRRTTTYSSTPSDSHCNHNLPLLNFQRDVCEELAKSYQKNKRFDWSIVAKVAEDHLLDRVIGGKMGLEHVDVFTSLLSRNMRRILANILGLLGDMDLISCRKVSKTWKRIVCEDTTAFRRCQSAEEALRESISSQTRRNCGLTREVAVSRVVLSCMQSLASSSTQSSSSLSTPSCKVSRRTAPSLRSSTPNSHFQEYVQAAKTLKQHESLRPCKHCGSPAKHLAEIQRATCTRPSCLYDFCTRCQEAFHGSTPCRTVQPRSHFFTSKTTQILPGSARSKRNVRRL